MEGLHPDSRDPQSCARYPNLHSSWSGRSAGTEAIRILRTNCAQCHTHPMSQSGLDLSSREAVLRGGSRGPALVAGKASESRLIEAVERKGKLAMPPAKTLTATEIDTLRRWIEKGALWADSPAAGDLLVVIPKGGQDRPAEVG
jgi:mono/diheme cytochrome c family protein